MSPPFPPLGIQLYSYGTKFSFTAPTSELLDTVVAAGYGVVEGQNDSDPAGFAALLQSRQLTHAGLHVTPARLRDVASLLAQLAATGARDICNSGLLDWNKRSTGDYAESIELFNTTGRRLRAAGVYLHYHNHEWEFDRTDGERTGMDLLLAGLDPAAVDLGLDLGWVLRAGHDPVGFLRANADRIGYLHLKDFNGTDWCPLGRGRQDWPALIAAIRDLPNVRWAVVEQDPSDQDPVVAAQLSRDYLRHAFGI